jgi:predicted nucleotidyltransferase
MVRWEPRQLDRIPPLCQKYGVRRLAIFGSALRDDFGPDSDLDLLVEFEPDARTGLRMFELEAELSDLLGRKVDLNTIGFLGPEFRERIRREARDLHVAS